jgi:hypothetical protein
MLIPIIKLCVIDGRQDIASHGGSVFTPTKKVELFAQCKTAAQRRFCESCGFIRINSLEVDGYAANSDDGKSLLPHTIQKKMQNELYRFTRCRYFLKDSLGTRPRLVSEIKTAEGFWIREDEGRVGGL